MSPAAVLGLACAGLLVGPLCSTLGRRVEPLWALVDGLALALIGGLCFAFVLPHAVTEIGFVALALALAGAAAPSLLHRLSPGRAGEFAVVGLALTAHVVLDGAVLAIQHDDGAVAWAVVAHRLPVGFAIVVAAEGSRRPMAVSWGLSLLMSVGTAIGYGVGPDALAGLSEGAHAALEAVVAGVLLHVVLAPHAAATGHGDPHDHEHHHHEHHHDGQHDHHHHGHHEHHEPRPRPTRWAASGALAGVLLMVAGAVLAEPHGLGDSLASFLRTFWVLVLESAPALILGYGLAGIVPLMLTPARASSLARGGTATQALRGVAFGLPLPVCSCGVLPLYESLVRRGAPPIAAMAFFVATPELGLDAVLLSVPLLGSSLTVARVIAAFAVALLVALLVGTRTRACGPIESEPAPELGSGPWSARLAAGLRFGFVEVFDHTMPWIALGLVIAAMAEPLLSHGALDAIPPALQVPIAAAVGVPIYVCASGATPIAAIALHKGLSAGAAIAFLIAGPATNVTTFGVLARLHGRRTALLFGLAVTALAVVAGWSVDALGISAAPILDAHAEGAAHGSLLGLGCALGLLALAVASLFRQGPRGALRQILEPIHVLSSAGPSSRCAADSPASGVRICRAAPSAG
ncbi:MAG: permease [Myxococcales bacterium]|nr:permease [Myxococcales bacterium]